MDSAAQNRRVASVSCANWQDCRVRAAEERVCMSVARSLLFTSIEGFTADLEITDHRSLTLGSGRASRSASSSGEGFLLFWATKCLSTLPRLTIKSWIWTGSLRE
jgi:hypothetical protein